MVLRRTIKLQALVVAFILAVPRMQTFADWSVRLNSTYLENGTFQYNLFMDTGAIVTQVHQLGLVGPFTNRLSYITTPPGWVADTNDAEVVSWKKSDPVPNPVAESFLADSLEQDFRTGDLYVTFIFDYRFCLFGRSTFHSANLAGFVRLSALVPAPTEESDGSNTNITAQTVVVPDPVVSQTNIDELTIAWGSDSTLEIEASSNLVDWVGVDTILGVVPTVTWTSSTPLIAQGNFFRAKVLAGCHDTNLINRALNFSGSMSQKLTQLDTPSVLALHGTNNKLEVVLQTVPGTSYEAYLEANDGTQYGNTQFFTAVSIYTTIYFPIVRCEEPVFVRIIPLTESK